VVVVEDGGSDFGGVDGGGCAYRDRWLLVGDRGG